MFDENNFLEKYQPNIMWCFLESPLPYTSISEETPITSGRVPLTLTNTVITLQRAMLLFCPMTLMLL
jgi:hypothetical protein